jgi:hypothetical protein
LHQKTSTSTDGDQHGNGFAASTRVVLAVVADLIAIVSLPVSALEGKQWTTIALVAGPVGVLASLLYLVDPRTRGRWARQLAIVLLIADEGDRGPDDDPTSTETPPAGPRVEFTEPLFSHDFSLTTSTSYDLDRRDTAFPSEVADLGLDSTSLYAPASGGMVLSERADSDPAGCQTDIPQLNRLPVADIPDDRTICVTTDQRRLATVTITAASEGEVALTYQLWQIQ